MAISAAEVLVGTVGVLSRSAPAIVAAASGQLGAVRLHLLFGDGSRALLRADQSRLIAEANPAAGTFDAEVHFDDRSLALLFDGSAKPSAQILDRSLDMRGERPALLACWRCFSLLARRASGLRPVQSLWVAYRQAKGADAWVPAQDRPRSDRPRGPAFWDDARWPALDWLERRHPAGQDLLEGGELVLAPARSLWTGRDSASWQAHPDIFDTDLVEIMQRCKDLVVEEILALLPDKRPKADLYDLMRDYVTREGKGLRPTLVMATCLAFGGRMDHAVRTAAALEMFHNGFLVHDDIADESTHRRGKPTLHESHGIGLAVNAGDAMNLFAVDMTLSNLASLGLARTLALIHEILHMCRETLEGQAIELGWIRRNFVPTRDADYSLMSTKKTGWYTCISPCRIGAAAAGISAPASLDAFNESFRQIGIAFQIQDDVLNLVGETALYGKEPLGDLLEGKRTVMMIHLFRSTDARTRARMAAINAMPRRDKTFAHAEEMLAAMQRAGSIDYAVALADRMANRGNRRFERDLADIPENQGKAVLRQIANYVTTRAL